jgi:hypothetical protein
MYKPTGKEAALILLWALEERGQRRGKPMTRARLSRLTLTRLWNRKQLTDAWIHEVNEWLLSAGWVLIEAGATFGVVKTDVVANWPRVASKHTNDVLDQVARGAFDFTRLEHLLTNRTTEPRSIAAPCEELKGSAKADLSTK